MLIRFAPSLLFGCSFVFMSYLQDILGLGLLLLALLLVSSTVHIVGILSRLRREPSIVRLGESSLSVSWGTVDRSFAWSAVKVAAARGESSLDACIVHGALEFRAAGESFIVFDFIEGYDRLCALLKGRGLFDGKWSGD